MAGFASARPARAKIAHLRFEAFDLKAHAGATRKGQDHFAGRVLSGLKDDGQKTENNIGLARPEAGRAYIGNALEMHAGLQALAASLVGRQPVETGSRERKALLLLQ